MPEMLAPSAALVGSGLGDKVALVTDGRFSGNIKCLSSLLFSSVYSFPYILPSSS